MPEISRFLGIIITMYWYENMIHHTPHFHARYNEYRCVYSIDDLSVIEGKLPARIHSYVIEWAQLHLSEPQENWNLVVNGKAPNHIVPLV